MKKFTLSLIFLVITGLLFAQKTISFDDFSSSESMQDENEVQTVMNSFTLKRISGFGGSTMSFTSINGEFSILSGGSGGIIINNVFIGGYGEGFSKSNNIVSSSIPMVSKFRHGGLWLGYEIAYDKMIHPVISTRMGWGKIKGTNNNGYFKENIFVVVPTVSAEINITRFCKVNIGAEYRQTLGADIGELKNSDFSNIGVYTNLVFGWF